MKRDEEDNLIRLAVAGAQDGMEVLVDHLLETGAIEATRKKKELQAMAWAWILERFLHQPEGTPPPDHYDAGPGVTAHVRTIMVGFPVVTVPVGSRASVTCNVTLPFRMESFIIPHSAGRGLLITDIRIGNLSLFPREDPLPAEAFSEFVGYRWKGGVVIPPQTRISLHLENSTEKPVRVAAGMTGIAAFASD